MNTRFPIYIPSKGRAGKCLTIDLLNKDNLDYFVVVEPQEFEDYQKAYGKERILVLPFQGHGSVVPSRNWIKEHAKKEGFKRHWQIDDDLRKFVRLYKGKKIDCPSSAVLLATEDFTDRYNNIAIAGIRSGAFIAGIKEPFSINRCVYGCILFLNDLPHKWRAINEDNDMSLQVLTDGWCTVLMNVFMFEGGYNEKSGGRHVDANAIQWREDSIRQFKNLWPAAKIVGAGDRRRASVDHLWKKFEQRPILKENTVIPLQSNEYGMKIKRRNEIESERVQGIFEELS
jgi:hypothetical protein